MDSVLCPISQIIKILAGHDGACNSSSWGLKQENWEFESSLGYASKTLLK